MQPLSLPSSAAAGRSLAGPPARPDTAAEAAKSFEAILVRQFVQVMTKDLFQESLAGEGAPMLAGQQDMQREMMTDILTREMTTNQHLGIADLLLKQWERRGLAETTQRAETPHPAARALPTAEPSAHALPPADAPRPLPRTARPAPEAPAAAPAEAAPHRAAPAPVDPKPGYVTYRGVSRTPTE